MTGTNFNFSAKFSINGCVRSGLNSFPKGLVKHFFKHFFFFFFGDSVQIILFVIQIIL